MRDLAWLARDSGVVDHRVPSGAGTPWLVGDFEDVVTELGWRVLSYDLDENDWGTYPAHDYGADFR